jgi:diaminopimelate decarboxylase
LISSHDRRRQGRTAHISVRVNPDVDAKTHAKIATGVREQVRHPDQPRARGLRCAAKLPGVQATGVDMPSAARSPS